MRSASRKLLTVFLLSALWISASAQKIPAKPEILYPVYDAAGLLTPSQKNELNQKLIHYSDSTSTEIEVIILPTTGGEDINFLAARYGEVWKIGQKGKNNGVVFMIATKDHTMAIQQGRSVEQYLTASTAGQILDYLVTPEFRKGNWYKGIDQGTSAIMEALQGKYKAKPESQKDEDFSMANLLVLVFIVIIIIMIFRHGSGGNNGDINISRRGRRNYPGGFIFFPGMGGGFGSGGGFGGGGFGSGGFGGFGGGGSFGGGGASGGW